MPPASLEPVPSNLLPFQVGEKVSFPDRVDPDLLPALLNDEAFQKTVEARHPAHRFAGMYGRVEAIGVADGVIQFDVTVIDPATGTPISEVVHRATMEEIQ